MLAKHLIKTIKYYIILILTYLSLLPSSIYSAPLLWTDTSVFHADLGSKPSSLDPHYNSVTPNMQVSQLFFNNLMRVDKRGDFIPGLVTAYEVDKENNWFLTLKQGVLFHDGSEMTARDIVYSLERMRASHPDSIITQYKNAITQVRIIDAYHLSFKLADTQKSLNLLLAVNFPILKYNKTYYSKASFESGEAIIGTGPYKLVSIEKDGTLKLKAFEDYHDKEQAPYIKDIELSFKGESSSRLDGFIAGKLHFLDNLTMHEHERLLQYGHVRFSRQTTDRLMHLFLNTQHKISPDITDHEGKLMNHNPLKNKAVREALSMAIDRDYLANEIFKGAAEAAGQLVLKGSPGYSPNLKPIAFTPKLAQKKLKQAGYPQGFRIVLHGPNDRYPKEAEVLKAIASMWSAIGVLTKVKTMPKKQYFPQAIKQHQFSVGLIGYTTYGDIRSMITDLLMKPDAGKNSFFGVVNAGEYNNHRLNTLIKKADKQPSKSMKSRIWRDANELSMTDHALIPLYFPQIIRATQPNIAYWPARNSETHLWLLKPVMP